MKKSYQPSKRVSFVAPLRIVPKKVEYCQESSIYATLALSIKFIVYHKNDVIHSRVPEKFYRRELR